MPAQHQPPILTVDALRAAAGEKTLLHNITLTLPKGQSLGIVGPNGAGKSTLLRHLAGLATPTGGTVLLHGHPIHRLPPKQRARTLAFLMQKPDIPLHYTALEVVQMARYPHLRRFQPETDRDRRLIRAALKQTNTLHLADRPLHNLSGGELQRLFLARALAQEPELLLLDEPTNHLDIYHQHELLGLLKQAQHQHGLTWVAVLHDLNLAAQYCDRLLLLHEGRLITCGTPHDILRPGLIEQIYHMKALLIEKEDLPFPQLLFLSPTTSAATRQKGVSKEDVQSSDDFVNILIREKS